MLRGRLPSTLLRGILVRSVVSASLLRFMALKRSAAVLRTSGLPSISNAAVIIIIRRIGCVAEGRQRFLDLTAEITRTANIYKVMGLSLRSVASHDVLDRLLEDLLGNLLALGFFIVIYKATHSGIVETAELACQILFFGVVLHGLVSVDSGYRWKSTKDDRR